MDENNNRPVHEIRMSGVKASIWKNETKTGGSFYSASFHTLYRDSEGSWRRSSSFGREDLLLLAKVANEVHTYMVLQVVPVADDSDDGDSDEIE
tara:strand:- start:16 stop:297 length:282 start_codon:yes stop_codon:yes gene_type:complete